MQFHHVGQDPSYTLSGVSDSPVAVEELERWFSAFRSEVAAAGGPAVTDTTFMTFTNVIRREVRRWKMGGRLIVSFQWQGALLESAQFEICGFARGIYMAVATAGKVQWEQAQI